MDVSEKIRTFEHNSRPDHADSRRAVGVVENTLRSSLVKRRTHAVHWKYQPGEDSVRPTFRNSRLIAAVSPDSRRKGGHGSHAGHQIHNTPAFGHSRWCREAGADRIR